MHIKKALASADKAVPKVDEDAPKVDDAEDDTKGNDDDSLLNEMEELAHLLDRKKKKAKKLLSKRHAKVCILFISLLFQLLFFDLIPQF